MITFLILFVSRGYSMSVPDFGWQDEEVVLGGQKTILTCRYVAPGLTLKDLIKLYEEAYAEGDSLAGNPSKWPTNKGIMAVVNAVLEAIYDDKPPCSCDS